MSSAYNAGSYAPAASHIHTFARHLGYYVRHPGVVYYDLLLPFVNSPLQFTDTWLLQTHPFLLSLHFLLACFVLSFLAASLSRNSSVVDRSWAIVPVLYSWIFVVRSLPHWDSRLLSIAAVTTFWGGRLTFNYWRKGGYMPGHEDYRWPWLRQQSIKYLGLPTHTIVWPIFTLVFISAYQNILLWLLIAPICLEAWTVRYRPKPTLLQQGAIHVPWNVFDTTALCLCTLSLILELVADNHQWHFHQRKWALLNKLKHQLFERNVGVYVATKASAHVGTTEATDLQSKTESSAISPKDGMKKPASSNGSNMNTAEFLSKIEWPYSLGFCTTGAFRFSRHPNLFAELSFWGCMNLFAIATVFSTTQLSSKLNIPVPVMSGVLMASDWKTLVLLTHRATRMVTIPMFRYTHCGVLNLWALLNVSTYLTEWLSATKYPAYSVYQSMTSRWVPVFNKRGITANEQST